MKKKSFNTKGIVLILLIVLLTSGLVSCSKNEAAMQSKIDSLEAELKKVNDEKAMVAKNMKTFETADFDVFSNQKWDRLSESHAKDIIVNYPDGHSTKGLAKHIEDIKDMFVYAPDTKIRVHPIGFGAGDWTCATGIMTGTFSKPMPIGGGKFIPPTGKSFSITLCTIGHWKDGVMIEESALYDSMTFMKQMGLAK